MLRFGPAAFSALDVETFAVPPLGAGRRETSRRRTPKSWFDDLPPAHRALDHAAERGAPSRDAPAADRKLFKMKI